MENKLRFLKLESGEQVFTGEVFVNNIKGIRPRFVHTNPMAQAIEIDVSEGNLATLFYDIWAVVGDDVLSEWLMAEDKQMIDSKKT